MNTLEDLHAFISINKIGNVCAERNIAARSRNHCFRGEKIITYSESVFVTLVMQHAKRMHHIVICGLFGSKIFFPYYLINITI